MRKLLLFDIDMTLVRPKPGSSAIGAMYQAMEERFQRPAQSFKPIRVDGKTDPLIVQELHDVNGIHYNPDTDYEPFLACYLKHLDTLCKQGEREALPGAVELVRLLEQANRFHLAVVTGNDRRGAAMKLAAVGLEKSFPVGAYGSDSAIREDLVPLALSRAKEHYRYPMYLENTVIIGDSHRDVEVASAHGTRCLAVATGSATVDELEAAGPCLIVEDFSDPEAVLWILDRI